MTILSKFENTSDHLIQEDSAALGFEESAGDAPVDLQFSGSVVVAQVCYEEVCWSDAEWDEGGKPQVIVSVIVSGVRLSGGLGEFRARLKAVVD